MAIERPASVTLAPPDLPIVREITPADLVDALYKGIDDFKAKPSHVVFIGVLYPVVGLILARLTFGYDVLPLLFPLIAGFSLMGPFVAICFYELSRLREQGEDPSWWHVFEIVRSRSFRSIVTLGLVLMAIFLLWIQTAQLIYTFTFGEKEPASLWTFAQEVLTTRHGWELIVLGNAVGFLFALLTFSISVVSFPMLLDRDGSAAAAVVTSVKAVLKNPVTMMIWAFIIAASLFLGSLPFFFGLAVVVPILGHASWHVYRKVVAP